MREWLTRTEMLLGAEALDALEHAHVAVFGVGGVGGYAVEALVRCGLGAVTIVDSDTVDITNLNRQIIATTDTLGQPKVEVMAQRIARINPNCHVSVRRCFYLPETAGEFDLSRYDYVVDAVDTVTAKLQLIEEANRCGTPIISSMGTAGKLDPTAFEVADIYDTSACPLAKVIRKECRKRGIARLKVVYSREPAIRPQFISESASKQNDTVDQDQPGTPSANRRNTPGSASFVPPVAGLIIASQVILDLIESAKKSENAEKWNF